MTALEANFQTIPRAIAMAILLLTATSGRFLQAQGLGDFSAPPPEPTPPKQTVPAAASKRPTPGETPQPQPMRYERLMWFSREMLCGATGQGCDKAAAWPLQTSFADVYYLDLAVPGDYCSPLYLTVEVDGMRVGRTGLLAPGQSQVLRLGELPRGDHLLRVTARGEEGGCNAGVLLRWGVDLTLSNNPSLASEARQEEGNQ
jgi:hypothetical protein